MIKPPFPPRNLPLLLAAWTVLTLAILACGLGAGAPADEPQAPSDPLPSQPAPGIQPTPTPGFLIPVTGGGGPEPVPTIPERRKLTLEFPAQIRAGDSDLVRLTLEVDDLGSITPTAQFEGNIVSGEVVQIPDLYESHHVIAEAKMELAGVQVSPSDLTSQTLSKGQEVNFYWSVRPTDTGNYRGTVWFYLRFVDKFSGEESRKTVSVQIVEFEAVGFLGLPAGVVRTAGGIGSVVGAVVGFPFFEDITKFTLGRMRRRRNPRI